MAFVLEARDAVAEELRRIAREQVEGAIEGLTGRAEMPSELVVHDARKRFKRVRALLRLARGGLRGKALRREQVRFRDLGRLLASSRDAEVMVQAFDRLAPRAEAEGQADRFVEAREVLQHRRRDLHDPTIGDPGLLPRAAEATAEARDAVEQWPIRKQGWTALAPGLRWIYRQGRLDAGTATNAPTDEALHDWRKRVKDYWHALEILQPIRPELLAEQAEAAHRLADLLGEDHDLAVLRAFLDDPERDWQDPEPPAELRQRIDNRRAELRRKAFPLGHWLYRDRPSVVLDRFEIFWRACEADREFRGLGIP